MKIANDVLDKSMIWPPAISEWFPVASALALAAWGLYNYHRKRVGMPAGKLENCISVRPFGDKSLWVHVEMSLENKGQTRILLKRARCRLQQCLPEHAGVLHRVDNDPGFHKYLEGEQGEVQWPPPLGPGNARMDGVHGDEKPLQIVSKFEEGRGEVEPGETESVHFDFFITTEIRLLYVYTELLNTDKDPESKPRWWKILNKILLMQPTPLCWVKVTFVEVDGFGIVSKKTV